MHKAQIKQKETNQKTETVRFRELEERTTEFARNVVRLCKKLPQNTINNCLIGQIIRSADSIGANYREANEALSKKDFVYRIRISRKEAKETVHWLVLIAEANNNFSDITSDLIEESKEFRNIFSGTSSQFRAAPYKTPSHPPYQGDKRGSSPASPSEAFGRSWDKGRRGGVFQTCE